LIGFWSGERPEIAENFKKIIPKWQEYSKESSFFLAQPIYRVAQPVPSLIHIYYINMYITLQFGCMRIIQMQNL